MYNTKKCLSVKLEAKNTITQIGAGSRLVRAKKNKKGKVTI